jgi:hypothetical protein
MRLTIGLLLLLISVVVAQEISGEYTMPGVQASVTLNVQQDASGKVTGRLQAEGIQFTLEGDVDPEDTTIFYGYLHSSQGTLLFEAYLEGAQLYFYVLELTPAGEIDYDNATELLFERHSQVTQSGGNANPLAQSPAQSTLSGTFAGDGLQLTLEATASGYSGSLTVNQQTYPVQGTETAGVLSGSFEVNGAQFAFTATLMGDTLTLVSDGAQYTLQRRSANPLGQSSSSGAAASLAQGQYGVLTEDNANAFIEALEFSLRQVGYTQAFSQQERVQMRQAIAQAFPQGTPEEQAVLSQARDIWTRVQQNWEHASDDDKREFLLGVFVLAFGEAQVSQWVNASAASPSGSSGRNCGSFEECTSHLVSEQTWTDTFNAQGCWAAAGCSDYDPGSQTFSYDTYD